MKKMRLLSLAVAAVLCAGFVSCEEDPDKPKNTITENTNESSGNDDSSGGASGNDDNTGNDGNDNGNNDVGCGYSPANPEIDEYGIAVSQEVDLGLSVNWAGWNVGATSPKEYGGYYAWGEVEEKSIYYWTTYKWCNGGATTLTKYCTDSYYGIVDNKRVLEPQDDVAHMKWGNGWRMPTEGELEELKNNCTWEWISYNDINGYKVTGKPLSNGKRNSIFLPAAGHYGGNSTLLDYAGSNGYYWGSTFASDVSCRAHVLDFSRKRCDVFNFGRYHGYSVRPVK